MKFGLGTITTLCAALGHPEQAFPSIHVAGTNGKGSVTAMVHEGLTAAGHLAGRYTSPHLERLEERFVIGGHEVPSDELEAAAGVIRDAIERLQRAGVLAAPPTFFESVTAVAFELFRRARVEVAVIEVGLGGRLDATNVITPRAAAITSIDFDHEALLGSTLESIAFEKAGIIKPEIPVVCGPLPPAAETVIRRVAAERGARFIGFRDDPAFDRFLDGAAHALRGSHQADNAWVAARLLHEIDGQGLAVPDAAITAGLRGVRWPGRLEHVEHDGRDVLIDAAHNPAGARALASYIDERGWTDATLVFGAMQDKDVPRMLTALAPVFDGIVCTTAPGSRALAADTLAAMARAVPGARWRVSAVDAPETALARALHSSPRVAIAGSIFLIGPLRGILRTR